MEVHFADLGEQAFLLINGPLVVLNLAANIFYACCLVFPPCKGRQLRQPLKMLLGCLVCCSIAYLVYMSSMYDVLKDRTNIEVSVLSWLILLSYVQSSMACSVWLTFYYYVRIVPSQRALLIWVKRNIRSFIYLALLLEEIVVIFCGVINSVDVIFQAYDGINGTHDEYWKQNLHFISLVSFCIVQLHILACLCIKTISSFSTVHYLLQHQRNLVEGRFSSPRLQSQMRVTITGISQGVFFFLSATIYFLDSFTTHFSTSFSLVISVTVTSLYVSGTTINLGIGQTIFRRRAADVCEALKALCGVVGQVKTTETANTVSVDV